MDWQSIKQYVSGHVTELIVTVILGGLIMSFLWAFFQWIVNSIKKCIKKREQQKTIREKLTSFTKDQLQKQINSKKYLPDFYIEINQVKENLRYFCYPFLFCNKLIDHVNRLDFSYANSVLERKIKQKIVFKNFRKLSRFSLVTIETKIKELGDSIDQNLKVLERMPENDNNFPRQARRKIQETIEKTSLLKSRVLVLLDDAGQGKTNLICDLTRGFLLKLEIPVALFFGADFYGLSNNSINSFVSKKITDGTDFNVLNQFIENECKKKKTNFIIIIDALNESSDGIFPNALDAFVKDVLNNTFVKIILTCRTEYYNLNFKMIETSSYASHITTINGINSKLEEHEKENLFRKYLSFFNITWNFFSGRVYEKLVSNFLLLRIFCEVHQEQNIGSILNVYMLDLFQKYYRQIRDGIKGNVKGNASIEKVVCEIVRHMVDAKTYKDVPIQKIIDNAKIDKSVLFKLIDENIFFRRDVTDKAGVLLDREVINFTFDEIRDYLIADYLVNILLAENESTAIKFISEEILPAKPLFEGVSKYLFFFSKKDRRNKHLPSILESSSWYLDKYVYYLFETNDVDLNSEDICRVKEHYLSGGNKSEFILKMLIHYRYDSNTYKNLNISMLCPILTEMPESERIDKFEQYFHANLLPHNYGSRQNEINLDHYFKFITDSVENGIVDNPATEFLFFIITCNTNLDVRSTAKHALTLIYKKYPEVILKIFKKYQNCNNHYFRAKADYLIKEYENNK